MSKQKLAGVEAARGIAALLVLLRHASYMLADAKYLGSMPLGGLFKFAHAGVDFFFVLSGFIIFFVHHRDIGDPSRLQGYALRRLIRIFPAYWCVLAVYGLMLWWSPTVTRFEQQPAAVASALLLLPYPQGAILGPAWSLSHELLFYALFGALLLNRTWGFWVLGVWAVATATQQMTAWAGTGFWLNEFAFRVFNLHFFFGMSVAWLATRNIRVAAGPALLLGILLFFGTGLVESFGPKMPPEWAAAHLSYALGSALTLYGIVGLERAGRLRVPWSMEFLGKASYAVYLVHILVIMVWQQALLKVPALLHAPLAGAFWSTVLVALAVSVGFHLWVEAPLGRWTGSRLKKFL